MILPYGIKFTPWNVVTTVMVLELLKFVKPKKILHDELSKAIKRNCRLLTHE
jgi:hypothetical protein